MKFYGFCIVIFILSMLLTSCVERINIELNDSYTRLVVDGSVTTDTIAHTIKLTRTASYYYDQPTPPVSGARLQISDGSATYLLKEETPGVYRTDPSVHGFPGRTYTLNIQLDTQIGGYTDYSAKSELHPITTMDSVSLAYHPDWSELGVWEIRCYVQDPPTTDFYRFRFLRNGKMLSDTLAEWFVTDDRFFNGNYVYGAPIGYLRQDNEEEKLKSGDTISVEMSSIGVDYANFIWDAQDEIRGSNPLFSGPPANVKGNISNEAIGFFAAYSVNRAYTILRDTVLAR